MVEVPVEDGASINTLRTRRNSYSKGPAVASGSRGGGTGGKGKGTGKNRDVRITEDQQRAAVKAGLRESGVIAERAAVVVGDPRSSAQDLDKALEELRGHHIYLRNVHFNLLPVAEAGEAQRALLRRQVELEVSIQILETRRRRGFPSLGASAAAGADGGAGTPHGSGSTNSDRPGQDLGPVAGRLRALSTSAATGGGFGSGGGFRGTGANSGSLGDVSGVGGGTSESSMDTGRGSGSVGAAGTSSSPWGTGGNPYLVSGRAQTEEYWLGFPFPWNVVPPRHSDLKPGDVMKITASALPKFGGHPRDYIPWRSAFLPCVHVTTLDLSLKVMLLMGTLESNTAQMREIKGSFVGNELGYRNVITLLESTFGGEHNLLVARQQALLSVPLLREGNYEGLELLHIRLGTFLMEWGNAVGGHSEVDSLAFFHIMMRKLAESYARKYEDWMRKHPHLARGLKSLHVWAGEQLSDHRRVASYQENHWSGGPPPGDRRGQAPPLRGRYGGGAGGGGVGGRGAGGFPWGNRAGGAQQQQHFFGEHGNEEGGWHEVEEDFGVEEEGHQHFYGEDAAAVCGYCSEQHLLGRCPKFRALTPQEKRDWLGSKGRCYSCFQIGHNLRTCPRPLKCKKCGDLHNTALHGSRRRPPGGGGGRGGQGGEGPHLYHEGEHPDPEGAESADEHAFLAREANKSSGRVSLRTIGLWLGNPRSGKEEYVNALLDDGSTGSVLLSEELAAALGLTGHVARTLVEGVGGSITEVDSLLTQVRVRSYDGKLLRLLPAQVMGKPAGTYRPVDWNREKARFGH